MTYEFITIEREARITTITLNRPEAMNALNNAIHWELHQAFDDFAADPDQWVAIVTGAGERAFCAGGDVKAYAREGRNKPLPPSGYAGLILRENLDKPVIAAVNGVALGGGFEIALACDLIIASENARFGLPEPKVGLAALAGGLQNLTRQIPLKLAMGMILTGRMVSAAEGASLGFVNEVVAHGDLMLVARRWADEIASCSPLSIRASKHVAMASLGLPFAQAMVEAGNREPLKKMLNSQDVLEGPRAFAEKRAPQWLGR